MIGKKRGPPRGCERETGLTVFAFPKEQEYFVEMKLAARL